MPLFAYSGFDAQGKRISGVVEAAGKRAAVQKLRSQQLFATELYEEKEARTEGAVERRLRRKRKVPTADLAAATRQLATLLGAGLPLDEALATVSDQLEHPALGRAIERTREEVMQGSSLHQGLGEHPKIFPELYVNMVQVGESSGTLDQALHRLADFLEDQARIQGKIRAALAYPMLMTVIGTGVLLFLLTFVVPKITRMLEDLGQKLPLPTLLLIRLTDFCAAWWPLLLAAAVAAALGLRRYLRTERGRLRMDRLKLTLPLFGRLNLLLATARLTRTLATLLRSGVPLLGALEIVQNLLPNQVLKQVLEEAAVAVREGEGLAAPLRRSGVFPPMVAKMAEVGERSGQLEEMFQRVAEAYEAQVDAAVSGLLSLLEPLMILAMGGAIGYIVLAILLPIFEASQAMG